MMDKKETAQLAQVATDVQWIKAKLNELVSMARSTDKELETVRTEQQTLRTMVTETGIHLDNYKESTQKFIAENLPDHKHNTEFRKNFMWVIGVVVSVGIPGIVNFFVWIWSLINK